MDNERVATRSGHDLDESIQVNLGILVVDTDASVTQPGAGSTTLDNMTIRLTNQLDGADVVLMVGGNIPGETRVVSIAIYDHVESLDYAAAHQMSIVLVVIAFAILLLMFLFNRRPMGR